jgi:hypothetical protein
MKALKAMPTFIRARKQPDPDRAKDRPGAVKMLATAHRRTHFVQRPAGKSGPVERVDR